MKIKLIFGYRLLIFFSNNKYNSRRDRERFNRFRKKRVASRQCTVCKELIEDINHKTNGYYRKCPKCRKRENTLCKLRRLNKKT